MYTTKQELERAFNIDYISELEFSSSDIPQKIIRRSTRKLKWQKHARVNLWNLALFESQMNLHKEIGYVIKKVNPIVGFGAFASENIPPLTFIGEYTGVVRKRQRRRDRLNDYVFGYVIGPHDSPWVIDANKKGNFTRFINHSFEPNVSSKWYIKNGISHIIFFANKLIGSGEQFTYDYGPYYWRRRPYPLSL